MDYINCVPYNSFEFGKANKRHKIYYQTTKELTTRLLQLQNLGLIDDSGIDFKKLNENKE